MEQVCKNCEQRFNGVYCSNCGQKFDAPEFTFKHIFHEAFHAFTHADKSLIGYIKTLVINPGKVTYEYIVERKRKKYFNPFTFFVLITAINAFIEGLDLNLKEKLFHENNEYGHLFNVYSKALSIIIIPIVAFIIWLIHSKKPSRRYSEYTVFVMMLLSLISVIEIVVHALDYCCTSLLHRYVSLEDNVVYLILVIAYIAYADYGFHIRMGKKSMLRGLLVGSLFILAAVGIQIFIIYAVINNFRGIGHFGMYGIQVS